MNHTKGPWVVYPETDGTEICAVDLEPGLPVRQIICNMRRHGPWIANAHRIVACVNACAGIETEALEKHALQVIRSGESQVEHQRDALLHAAQNLRNVKGRFHTEQAMEQLLFVLNQIEEQMK